MYEKVLWFLLALAALFASLVFLIIQHDPVMSGASSLIALVFLQFRAQATN